MKKYEGALWAVAVIGVIVYLGVTLFFAFQTWQLVNWLFPSQLMWMQVATVFVFDGMAFLYALLDTFYVFQHKASKIMCQWFWGFAFLLAALATGLQIYMDAAGRLAFTYDKNVISSAYAMVAVAFVVHMIVLTTMFRVEWASIVQYGFQYEPQWMREKKNKGGTPVQVTPASPSVQNQPNRIPSASSQGGVSARPLAQRTPYRAPLNNGNTRETVDTEK